jgi:hypothetical protein
VKALQEPHANLCGAKTRTGLPCLNRKMPNGRCRMHGGKSTGPKTAEGRARIATARTVHGGFTKQAKAEAAEVRTLIRSLKHILSEYN